MPDLPGPIKMRQLLLWAVQRAGSRQKNQKVQEMAEETIQALFNNQINSSWYQRPISKEGKSGPKNQELSDCIQLYERYSEKLKRELVEWEQLESESRTVAIEQLEKIEFTPNLPLEHHSKQLESLSKWFDTLPSSSDQLYWNLSVAKNFEEHARTFCENVFYQIRARLFGSDTRPAPMMLLRALSTASQN